MTEPMEQVVSLFKANQWQFSYQEEGNVLQAGMNGDNGDWHVLITDVDEGATHIMASQFPQKCPRLRRLAFAELITRVNFGLTLGFFEMNYSDGRIYLKTVLPLSPGRCDSDELESAIMANVACMDWFIPLGMAVIHTRRTPKQALDAYRRKRKRAKRSRSRLPKDGLPPTRLLNN